MQIRCYYILELTPWEAILSKAPPHEYLVKYIGNPMKSGETLQSIESAQQQNA